MNKSLVLIEKIDALQKTDEAVSRSLTRIQHHMNSGRELGVISSQRVNDDQDSGGDGHILTPQEHNQRHQQLKKDIKAAGYSYTSLHGNYHGNHERSVMVFGKEKGKDTGLKDFLIKKGREYSQDSILHKPHDKTSPDLHFTMNRNGSKVGDNFPLGRMRANKTGKFGSTEIVRGEENPKPGKTPASKKSFAFSDGKIIKTPKPGRLRKSLTNSGLIKDNSVWTPK